MKGKRGQEMVREQFRKMLSGLIESEYMHVLVLLVAVMLGILDLWYTESGIDPAGLRTHSCRRTAAYYSSWLGIPESTIKVQ